MAQSTTILGPYLMCATLPAISPKPEVTQKGHMQGQKQGVRSTKMAPINLLQPMPPHKKMGYFDSNLQT
jgi:hypothetical protein